MVAFKEKRHNTAKHTKMIQEFKKVDPFTIRVNRRELLLNLLLKHGIHGAFHMSNSYIARCIYTSSFYVADLMYLLHKNNAIRITGYTNKREILVLYENIRDKKLKELFRRG